MNIELFRNHCLSKKGVIECTPFDHVTLVFKVMGKMFALTNIDTFESINLKCDPEIAIELREKYDGLVLPAYHMNKKHWNTIKMGEGIATSIIISWVDTSYDLVVAKLPKKIRNEM